jgi:hypothetical protein
MLDETAVQTLDLPGAIPSSDTDVSGDHRPEPTDAPSNRIESAGDSAGRPAVPSNHVEVVGFNYGLLNPALASEAREAGSRRGCAGKSGLGRPA